MRSTWHLLALAVAFIPSTAPAQTPPGSSPTVIALRPADEPVPALKYRLVPERRQSEPGNAALFYHRAIQFLIHIRMLFTIKEKQDPEAGMLTTDQKIVQWASGPLGAIPRDEARQLLAPFANVFREVELGAARRECDWGFDRRTEGNDLLLPEIGQINALARLVALRTRLAILDGKTDEALHWIQIGLTLCRHLADGPTIIQALDRLFVFGSQ